MPLAVFPWLFQPGARVHVGSSAGYTCLWVVLWPQAVSLRLAASLRGGFGRNAWREESGTWLLNCPRGDATADSLVPRLTQLLRLVFRLPELVPRRVASVTSGRAFFVCVSSVSARRHHATQHAALVCYALSCPWRCSSPWPALLCVAVGLSFVHGVGVCLRTWSGSVALRSFCLCLSLSLRSLH